MNDQEQSTAPTSGTDPSGLSRLVARGAVWSMTSYGGAQVIRLISTLVLTRLLFEEAFGLMALVAAFFAGLELLSDFGIGPSIIQNKRGDEASFINTAWTIQVGRGVALFVIGLAGAVPFARFYGEPQLASLIPVVAVAGLITGFNSTKLFTAQRNLAIKHVALVTVASSLAGTATMIAWAFFDRSVWALASGNVVNALVRMLLSHIALPGTPNRLHWDANSAQHVVRFGRWVFLSTVLTFAARHTDRLIFGKLIPIGMLGVYSIGATLASVPTLAINSLASQVLFPACSRVFNEQGDLGAVFRRMRLVILAVGGWIFSGFVAGGQTIIDILYDDRYVNAGWVVQMLSMSSWFTVLGSTAGAAFFAKGEAYHVVSASLVRLACMVALIPLGFHFFAFPGAVAGFAGSEALRYVVTGTLLQRSGMKTAGMDLSYTALVVGSALLSNLAGRLARQSGAPLFVEALVIFVVTTLVWLPTGAKAWKTWRTRSL